VIFYRFLLDFQWNFSFTRFNPGGSRPHHNETAVARAELSVHTRDTCPRRPLVRPGPRPFRKRPVASVYLPIEAGPLIFLRKNPFLLPEHRFVFPHIHTNAPHRNESRIT